MAKVQTRLPPLPTIKDILRMYNLRAVKNLSQNFLMEPRLIDKIARAAGTIEGGHVVEVGPGPGNITRSIIARNPASVTVIEKDRRFLPALEMLQEASPCPVKIILDDVLSVNMKQFFPDSESKSWADNPPNIHIIGNLPFNVATPLIIRWLRAISEKSNAWAHGRVKLTLTFQKEVAERMVAPILARERCRLSIMAQNWCFVHHKFTIPGRAFVPKPDVDVGVVHFIPHISPVIDLPFKLVEKVVRSLFGFRQKYCIKSLGTLFPLEVREKLSEELMQRAQIAGESRSFQLTVPEIRRLCYAYSNIIDEHPSLANYNSRGPMIKYDDLIDLNDESDLFVGENDGEKSECFKEMSR